MDIQKKREKLNEYMRKYYSTHKQYFKNYYIKNKERLKEYYKNKKLQK